MAMLLKGPGGPAKPKKTLTSQDVAAAGLTSNLPYIPEEQFAHMADTTKRRRNILYVEPEKQVDAVQALKEGEEARQYQLNWTANRTHPNPAIQKEFDASKPAKLKNINNTYLTAQYQPANQQGGGYNLARNKIDLDLSFVGTTEGKTAAIHEFRHSADMGGKNKDGNESTALTEREIRLLQDSNNDTGKRDLKYQLKNQYYNDPNEQAARVQAYRHELGLQPNEVVTPELLKQREAEYMKKNNGKMSKDVMDFKAIFRPDKTVQLLNDLSSTNKGLTSTPIAKQGGELGTIMDKGKENILAKGGIVDAQGNVIDTNQVASHINELQKTGKISNKEARNLQKGLQRINTASNEGVEYKFAGDGIFTATKDGKAIEGQASGLNVNGNLIQRKLEGRKVSKALSLIDKLGNQESQVESNPVQSASAQASLSDQPSLLKTSLALSQPSLDVIANPMSLGKPGYSNPINNLDTFTANAKKVEGNEQVAQQSANQTPANSTKTVSKTNPSKKGLTLSKKIENGNQQKPVSASAINQSIPTLDLTTVEDVAKQTPSVLNNSVFTGNQPFQSVADQLKAIGNPQMSAAERIKYTTAQKQAAARRGMIAQKEVEEKEYRKGDNFAKSLNYAAGSLKANPNKNQTSFYPSGVMNPFGSQYILDRNGQIQKENSNLQIVPATVVPFFPEKKALGGLAGVPQIGNQILPLFGKDIQTQPNQMPQVLAGGLDYLQQIKGKGFQQTTPQLSINPQQVAVQSPGLVDNAQTVLQPNYSDGLAKQTGTSMGQGLRQGMGLRAVNAGLGIAGAISYATAKQPKLQGPQKYQSMINPAQGMSEASKRFAQTQIAANTANASRGLTSDARLNQQVKLQANQNANQALSNIAIQDAEMMRQDQQRVNDQTNRDYAINFQNNQQFQNQKFDLANQQFQQRRAQSAGMVQNALTYENQRAADMANKSIAENNANSQIGMMAEQSIMAENANRRIAYKPQLTPQEEEGIRQRFAQNNTMNYQRPGRFMLGGKMGFKIA